MDLFEDLDLHAERLYETYRDHMDEADKGLYAIAKGGLDKFDYLALGKMHENVDLMRSFLKRRNISEAGSNDLGIKPNVMHDAVTLFFNGSIAQLISSTQPIRSRRGIVYYQNVDAGNTAGNLTAKETIASPGRQIKSPSNYADALVPEEILAVGDGVETSFSGVLANNKIQIHTLQLRVGNTLVSSDFGPEEGGSKILGRVFARSAAGATGSINYATGAYQLDFITAPANGADIKVEYQIDWEEATEPRIVETGYTTKQIQAEVFALKGRSSIIKDFEMSQIFSASMNEEDMLKTLTDQMNLTIGSKMIRKLKAAAPSAPVEFDKTAPGGVSFMDHKQSLYDRLADSEAQMVGNAGQGTINTIIAGRELCAIYETLYGFKKLSSGKGVGPQIFGDFRGMTVIRVSEDAVLGPRESINIHKGSGFLAPLVYSPFMPLTSTGLLPEGLNPLGNHIGAVQVSGIDTLTENFITTLNMIES